MPRIIKDTPLENEVDVNKVAIADYVLSISDPRNQDYMYLIDHITNPTETRRTLCKDLMKSLLLNITIQERLIFSNALEASNPFFNFAGYDQNGDALPPMLLIFKELIYEKSNDDIKTLTKQLKYLSVEYDKMLKQKDALALEIFQTRIANLIKEKGYDKILDQQNEFPLKTIKTFITNLAEKDEAEKIKIQKEKEKPSIISIASTLMSKGYLTIDDFLYTNDIKSALKGYYDPTHTLDKPPITIYLTEIDIHNKDFVEKETFKEFIKSEIARVKKSDDKKPRTIFFPTNNGAAHFVLLKIIVDSNGVQSSVLIDPMSAKQVESKTQESKHSIQNEIIKKNIEGITHGIKCHIDYANMQGNDAACGFHVIREIVKEFAKQSPEFKTENPNDYLSEADILNDSDINPFKLAAIKKIARNYTDPTNKNWADELSLDEDDLGIVHKNTKNPDQSKEYESHVKSRKDMLTYQRSKISLEREMEPKIPIEKQNTESTDTTQHNISTTGTLTTPTAAVGVSQNNTSSSTAPVTLAPKEDHNYKNTNKEQVKNQASYADLLASLDNLNKIVDKQSKKANKIASDYESDESNDSFKRQLPLISLLLKPENISSLDINDQKELVAYLNRYTNPYPYSPISEEKRLLDIFKLGQLSTTHSREALKQLKTDHTGYLFLLNRQLSDIEYSIDLNPDEMELDDLSLERIKEKITSVRENIKNTKIQIENLTQLCKTYKPISLELLEKIERVKSNLQENKKRNQPKEEPSVIGMILFIAIMTQQSIDDNHPTREYLDRLYRDDSLFLFLETDEGRKEKDTIESLERDLVQQKIIALTTDYHTHLHTLNNSENLTAYIDSQAGLIQIELATYQNKAVQAKVIEHWINVMDVALQKNDTLTALIIKNALSTDPKYGVEKEWIADSAISPSAINAYSIAANKITQNKDEYIKAFLKELAPPEILPAVKQPVEEKVMEAETPQQKSMSKVYELIKEICKTEHSFYDRVDELKGTLTAVSDDKTNDDDVRFLAKQLKSRMIYSANETLFRDEKSFQKPLDELQLNDNIKNIQIVLEFFNSDEFKDSFNSCAEGIYDFEWLKIFLTENKVVNADARLSDSLKPDNIIYYDKATAQEIAILPIQRIPRYPLLLAELLKSTHELQNSLQPNERDKLTAIISQIDDTIKIVKEKAAKVNANTDSFQLNRKIGYSLFQNFKKLKKLTTEERNNIKESIERLISSRSPPDFYETYEILTHLPPKIKTDQDILSAFHTETERLQRKKNQIDINDINYDLKNLNYSIAIHLLNHIDRIDHKTQDKIIEHLKILNQNDFKTNPQVTLDFLKKINLTNIDIVQKQRLHRRDLKKDIAKYQSKETNKIMIQIQEELKEQKATDIASTDQMLRYLNQLKAEWDVIDSTLKPKDDPTQQSKLRIKLIEDAIDAISMLEKSDPLLITEIYTRLIQELRFLVDTREPLLSEKTIDAINMIIKLRNDNPLQSDSSLNEPFRELILQRIPEIKKEQEQILADFDANSIKEKDLNKLIIKYLELIQAGWTIQETAENLPAENKDIESRHNFISGAISKLGQLGANRYNILDKLQRDLAHEKTNTIDAVAAVRFFQKNSLRIVKKEEAEGYRLESIKLFQAIEKELKDGKPITVKQIKPYLKMLENEWKAANSSLKEKDEYSENRTKLISDAIVAISIFEHSDPIIVAEIYHHLIKELELPPDDNKNVVFENTKNRNRNYKKINKINSIINKYIFIL